MSNKKVVPESLESTIMVKFMSKYSKELFRAYPSAAGYDLISCDADKAIEPWKREIFSTGIAVALPKDTYGRIAPKSGLALKHGIDVMAGVVDGDFRGEVRVILINNTDNTFWIRRGDPIAQLIVEKIEIPKAVYVPELSPTARSSLGFGSTYLSDCGHHINNNK